MQQTRPDGDRSAMDAGNGTRRYRNVSGRPLDRRVVLKAAAGLSALAVAGGVAGMEAQQPAALAQGNQGSTRARRHIPEDAQGAFRVAATDEFTTFQAEFPFTAIGASWAGGVGRWPVIELMLSTDGKTWSEAFALTAFPEDGGRPNRKGRLFTPLLFGDGARYVRYRAVDIQGRPGEVAEMSFVYIDASSGPSEADLASADISTATVDTRTPPPIITRAEWGANESYRFDDFGQIWPPEYATVQKVIVHHTATSNAQDPVAAIRAIYYYHAVEQGWGDIGYNYLVDRFGRIYQGRFGGQNVIGGHSFQYAVGSSGIGTIGDFTYQDASPAAKAGLAAIIAFVGRDLNPYGRSDFMQAPNLPNICAHRDVNQTTCPGNQLYADLPEIRDAVAAALDELDTGLPGGIIPGDRVKVQTDDGRPLNIRSAPGLGSAIVRTLAHGATAVVADGPAERSDGNWYFLRWSGGSGWATAQFLIVAPVPPPGGTGDFPFGLNVLVSTEANVRSSPTTGAGIVAVVPRGTWAFIMAGPTDANGYEWYQIRTQSRVEGWTIKGNLTPAPLQAALNPKFQVGNTVEAISSLGIRARPGIAQTAIATVGAGTRFTISQAPVRVTGDNWYGVYSTAFGGGWVPESAIRGVSTTPPPPTNTKFRIGDTVRVTERLNLRSSPSTSGTLIAAMPAGTTGTVTAGPRTANGYVWWQIRTSYGTGWAVQDWLAATGSTPPPPTGKFGIGDRVRVTERLNLRSSASTSGSIVAVMPAGTIGTVTAGPRSANGYVWWQIRTSYGTGWAVETWLVRA